MKVLVIYEEIPEVTTMYLIDMTEEDYALLSPAHNEYLGSYDGGEGDRTPLIRAYIEEKGDNWDRYSYQSFTDMLDEEAHMIGEGCSEEEFFQYTGMTKVSIENLMWEILHNGYVGFTYDW